MKTLILMLSSVPLFAAVYYVDQTGGSDTNSGTSMSAPWKTVAQVNRSSFAPGDRILFKRGDLWRETLTISASGTLDNPITFGDYGAGAKPTFYGASTVNGWRLHSGSIYYAAWSFASNNVFEDGKPLQMKTSTAAMGPETFFYDRTASRLYVWSTSGASPADSTIEASTNGPQWLGIVNGLSKENIIIQNLHIAKTNYTGIYCEQCKNITIRWNDLEQTFQNAITVVGNLGQSNSTNITVTGNTITNAGVGRGLTGGTESECVGINAQGWQGGYIADNVIINQGGEGIQILAGARDVSVKRNRVINPYVTGVYVSSGWGNGGHVFNNTVANNHVELGPRSVSPAYTISTEHALTPVTANVATDMLRATFSLAFEDGYPIRLSSTGMLPAPLAAGALYYIRDLNDTQFKVAASPDGPAIDLTTAGSGSHRLEISHRVDGVNFHHNIGKGNGTAIGGLVFGSGAYYGAIRNVRVHHNVFVNDQIGIKAFGPTDDSTNTFSNNIISIVGYGRAYWIGVPSIGSNPHTNYQIDYDVVYGPNMSTVIASIGQWGDTYDLRAWRSLSGGHAEHTIGGDPLFTNPASDWSLRELSPAIDAGTVLSGVEQVRQGAGPDIGAHENVRGRLGSGRVQRLRNRHRATQYP